LPKGFPEESVIVVSTIKKFSPLTISSTLLTTLPIRVTKPPTLVYTRSPTLIIVPILTSGSTLKLIITCEGSDKLAKTLLPIPLADLNGYCATLAGSEFDALRYPKYSPSFNSNSLD